MFYFTCNESKIYESFTFWNNLQEKIFFFTLIEMHLYNNIFETFIFMLSVFIWILVKFLVILLCLCLLLAFYITLWI